MKKKICLSVGILFGILGVSFGQKSFTNCSAAFLNDAIVVDAYAQNGKSVMLSTTTGILTVCTVELSATKCEAGDKISFRIAIRDKSTRTVWMFSAQSFKAIDIRTVLKKCSIGDQIVLLTNDRHYALPHNEIQVL